MVRESGTQVPPAELASVVVCVGEGGAGGAVPSEDRNVVVRMGARNSSGPWGGFAGYAIHMWIRESVVGEAGLEVGVVGVFVVIDGFELFGEGAEGLGGDVVCKVG